MEILRQLVQSLVIIVMLAVFLELLLPSGTMRNYVKMVMGLLVTIAVLQVASNYFHGDFNTHVPKISTAPAASLEQVETSAKELSDQYKSRAVEDYRTGIAKQVLALARLNQDVSVLDAQVELNTSEGENFGRLQLIQLTVTDKEEINGDSKIVEPVEIEVGTNDKPVEPQQIPPENQQAMHQLAKTVADFYNLPEEQVQVTYTVTTQE
ncbi:MAG: stage III sporulation protein AF [Firmicutes bacterium]|nr:stage III sporulation protein AF [Bacillota bacterium]